jgi:rod shape-determining protein MreC
LFRSKLAKILWAGIIILFITLFLISTGLDEKSAWNPPEKFVMEVVGPLQGLIKATADTIEELWLKYFWLIELRGENTRLLQEIGHLKRENDQYKEMLATYQRVENLLQFKKKIDLPVQVAQVIGRDPTGWFESVIIDKGLNSGLKINMPVVNAEGVVGRLVAVSPNYAKVLLIIDQNSAVDCIIQRSREKGILKGISSSVCELDYILKRSDVRIHDRLVTSGLGRVFPKGIPVGEIISAEDITGELFKMIRVKPMVDFSKLEELLVILKEDPLADQLQDEE